jgi:soluble lytic murein transglycosylase
LTMLAHLAEALGHTQKAVRIGKAANGRGLNLVQYAYPLNPFPAYAPLRPPPETALLLGIARQESEFNGQIVSGAGARGILQVMPVTAKHVCKAYKLKCDLSRLLSDASYNAMIASAYVGDRLAEFSGSYVLTLAGYNAGPGRARQWIRAFGDPRDPNVDPIDWIHRIPFEETREYVQKVLSNTQIYRARLGEDKPLRIAHDLARPHGAGRVSTAASAPGESTPKQKGDSQPQRRTSH